MQWNLGDVFDYVAEKMPEDKIAVRCGNKSLSWSELHTQSNNLALALISRGLQPGDKVAVYSRNSVEYIVSLIGIIKARLVYVNINFRYRDEELNYIFSYTDSRAVIFGREYADQLAYVSKRIPSINVLVEINDDALALPSAERFSDLVSNTSGGILKTSRSPDDLLFLCTGGTTGMPKAVMWRQDDMFRVVANRVSTGDGVPKDWDDLASSLGKEVSGKFLLCPPLMHGAGMYIALNTLIYGGELILLPGERFNPDLFLRTIEKQNISSTLIIGDAIAQPLLECLDSGQNSNLSSLRLILSSAAPWSIESKRRLLKYVPQAVILDVMGSSEAASFGRQIVTSDNIEDGSVPRIYIGDKTKVFDQDNKEVIPGSNTIGFIARGGPVPVGYYKEPEKSAKTFVSIDGQRYSIPGDMAMVESDGSLRFLGRGNLCINSGGEKVYPQEVELAVMSIDGIYDAIVVGVPHARWGEIVVAVVQLAEGVPLDIKHIKSTVSQKLSDYKVPKEVITITNMERGPNGKANYSFIQEYANSYLANIVQTANP